MKIIIQLVAWVVLVTTINTKAAESTHLIQAQEKVLSTIYTVVNVDGYLDQKLHDEFWEAIYSTGASSNEVKQFLDELIDLDQVLEYPYEGWVSVKRSYELRSIYRSKKLDSLEKELERKLGNYFIEAKRNTASLLVAAANRTPMEARGQTFYVSAEMINQVLNGFKNSKERLSNLLNPNWRQSVTEQVIADMNLKLLTENPFNVSSEIVNGMRISTAETISGDNYLAIGMLHVPLNTPFDYEKSLQGSCEGAMTNAGATCLSVPDRWRGFKGITANTVAELDGAKFYITYTGYYIPEHKKVIWFTSINESSALGARMSVEDAKLSIMFDWE